MTALRLQQIGGPLRFAIGPHRLVLGRALASDLLVVDPGISRRHAELRVEDGAIVVKDLGSSNGVSINGTRIAEGRAAPDDVIAFGPIGFRVEAPARPPAWDDEVPEGTEVRALTELLPTRGHDREVRTLARLLDMAADLTGTMPLARLCDTVVELAFDHLDADRVVLLLDPARDGLPKPVAWRNRVGDAVPRVPRVIVERALHDLAPVVTRAAGQDPDLQSASVRLERVRSALCVPLQDGEGRVLGALYGDTVQRAVPFDDDDARAFHAFAGLAATAVARARFAQDAARERALRTDYERFLAPEVAELIGQEGAEALAGRRREVAILFGDLRGFSATAEHLPPEETAAILTGWFTLVSQVVFEQGGTLDKFIGDGFLAVWGAPVPRDDAADRALFAARAIRAAVDHLYETEGLTLTAGFGLNYGEVFAGNVGSDRRLEYTVVGDAVNVAARLCEEAGPAEILMTASLVRRVSDRRAVGPAEAMAIRGRGGSIEVSVDRNGGPP